MHPLILVSAPELFHRLTANLRMRQLWTGKSYQEFRTLIKQSRHLLQHSVGAFQVAGNFNQHFRQLLMSGYNAWYQGDGIPISERRKAGTWPVKPNQWGRARQRADLRVRKRKHLCPAPSTFRADRFTNFRSTQNRVSRLRMRTLQITLQHSAIIYATYDELLNPVCVPSVDHNQTRQGVLRSFGHLPVRTETREDSNRN